ncbi:nicotinate (nicotinamide) nucleotide adenylyltransferase [Allobaculum fili]|uniref:nicotinate (nicotinamide) nucleotide adenylyltransferase n=1 Tax=Allobaculum TaxID=174708 RepID=UPI001E3516AB|nr:nicotinate (nicotinamide) nucleotide adenylyltransferase [Allobaculum fili]
MKKVALLGGSFDPVHNGHIAMANAALEQLGADEVWFVPARISPLKDRVLTDPVHRLNMLRLACQQNEHFRISDVEFKRNGTSYTIDTIRTLKKQFDDIEFYWLIGADQAAQFEEWKDWQQLLKEAHFVVADRQQQLDLLKKDYGMIRLSMEPVDVSSSQIRTGFRLNLMPESVRQYCLDHELYLPAWIQPQMDPARFAHSCSVARLCRELARAHHLDEHKAWLIGLFHDIAKDLPKEEQAKWVKAAFPPSALQEHHAIWHGYAGSEIVWRIYGLYDPVIRNAISNHVKGTSYDPYAMIVFVSDKLDPLRGYDSSALYHACLHDLYNGFLLVKAENKAYLEKERQKNGRT